MYNFATNYWTKINPCEGSPTPSPRSGHSAVLHGSNMYVFGGKDDDSNKLNDLWVFNYNDQIWEELKPDFGLSPPPLPRSGHSACLYGDIMCVFGGIYDVTKELNDLHVY